MTQEMPENEHAAISKLCEIMRALRDPETGCPWDKEQDFQSILPYTIEEAYEVADAIERNHMKDLEDELGDLLLQVVYHAQIGEEREAFTFTTITEKISQKMIRRHPHVFGDEKRDKSAAQQTEDWERIKAAERAEKSDSADHPLKGVALGLPALTRAAKLQKRAERAGYPITPAQEHAEALSLIRRTFLELREDEKYAQFGRLLFDLVLLAREYGLDSEEALRVFNKNFIEHFYRPAI